MIANIGTGACQLTMCDHDKLCCTETIKVGTLRMLELMPDTLSASGVQKYLTPLINSTFREVQNLVANIQSDLLIAMGSSVRSLLQLSGRDFSGSKTEELSAADFDELMKHIAGLSFEDIRLKYHMEKELAETVIPCAIIISNLFRITGASRMLVPLVSTKYQLMQDFVNELRHCKDHFVPQIEHVVMTTAEKYHVDQHYGELTAALAEKLFVKLANLHGMTADNCLLLRIAALLHKTGMFINNQAYHKHSYYIISNTEIPGILMEDRKVAALTARYHRKSQPGGQHPDFMSLSANDKERVLKLSVLLRLSCALAQTNVDPQTLKVNIYADRVVLSCGTQTSSWQGAFADSSVQDYFSKVFAATLILK